MTSDGHHHHEHQHPASPFDGVDHDTLFSAEFWDGFYGSRPAVWSGDVNPVLADRAGALAPGRVLDVGAGEGGDALWFARRGWTVTAVDVSRVALDRGAAAAAAAGPEVAARITWVQGDLRGDLPVAGPFELVSAQFVHLPSALRTALHRRLAAVVAPGGTLLVVGHHPVHRDGPGHGHDPDLFATAEQMAEVLDRSVWDVVETSAPTRTMSRPDVGTIEVTDAVLVARRTP